VADPEAFKIASAQYGIDFLDDWGHYRRKLTGLVKEAVDQGARLLVFPEYAALELASLFPQAVYSSLARQLAAIQDCLTDFIDLHRQLAGRHQIYILAGSFPVHTGAGYRNRACFFAPDGTLDFQEKLYMTRFEKEQWGIGGGDVIKVFATRFGHIGVNICYDSEFPLIARTQVEAGAQLILVPSCTDGLAGYQRVRIGCRARALENQCYVVQSPTVGQAEWSEAVDINVGAAAVYTPVDYGFPSDGILVAGHLDARQWVYGLVEPARVRAVRETGQVFNYRDWPGQFQVAAGGAEVVAL
jgi:predicted amidohydrolase